MTVRFFKRMYQRRNINIRRQMYRNFNKHDTNEDQMQEKHVNCSETRNVQTKLHFLLDMCPSQLGHMSCKAAPYKVTK